jgi:hypothetical protein
VRLASVAEQLNEEHVLGRVGRIGSPHVDDAPGAGSIGQEQEVAGPGFTYGIGCPKALHDLRRVEIAGLAFPDAPDNAAHARTVVYRPVSSARRSARPHRPSGQHAARPRPLRLNPVPDSRSQVILVEKRPPC